MIYFSTRSFLAARLGEMLSCCFIALILTSCSGKVDDSENYLKIEKGQKKGRVVEILGEPSQVLSPPFESKLNEECESSASSQMVYDLGEKWKFLVYLDKHDEVICVNHKFRSH